MVVVLVVVVVDVVVVVVSSYRAVDTSLFDLGTNGHIQPEAMAPKNI